MKNSSKLSELLFDSESYYFSVFSRYESGEAFLFNRFNVYSFLLGPLWYVNRGVGLLWNLSGCFLFSFVCGMLFDLFCYYFAIFVSILLYYFVFSFPSNYIYYKSAVEYFEENGDVGLLERFETALNRGRRRRESMRW